MCPWKPKRPQPSAGAIHEKEHKLAFYGDAATGINGFLSNPNIPTLAASNGAGGTSDWASKTAAEIMADIRLMCSTVRKQSKGVHNPDTLLLPSDQYDIIAGMPRSDLSDTTILEHLMNNPKAFGLTTIEPLYTELTNAFVSGTADGAVVYERTKENIELRIPMELTLYPMQEQGLELIVPGESRIGGIVVRYPLAFLFFTGI